MTYLVFNKYQNLATELLYSQRTICVNHAFSNVYKFLNIQYSSTFVSTRKVQNNSDFFEVLMKHKEVKIDVVKSLAFGL